MATARQVMPSLVTPAVQLSVATEATNELVAAFARLIPQLSTSAILPDQSALAAIIAPCNTVLIAATRLMD